MSYYQHFVPLDPERHRSKRVRLSTHYGFAESLEVVPLGFTEIVPCSMWYPLFFARQGERYGVFAILGAGGRNVFLNPDGTWKVSIIPRSIQLYPLGVAPAQEDEFVITVNEKFLDEEQGEPLFDAEGAPTPYLENLKTELMELARDLREAARVAEELFREGLLTSLNLRHTFPFGEFELRNALTADMRALIRVQPEKLYYLNTRGYLPLLFSQNLSLRNLTLFELLEPFEGRLRF